MTVQKHQCIPFAEKRYTQVCQVFVDRKITRFFKCHDSIIRSFSLFGNQLLIRSLINLLRNVHPDEDNRVKESSFKLRIISGLG